MSFEIKTEYFDCVTALHEACQVHTVSKDATWCGAYANVYDLGDRVMKVSGGDDMGYLSFLETMAELNITNKHLPVIHSVIYYRLTDEARKENRFYKNRERIITYMEKLVQPPKHYRNVWDKRGNLIAKSAPPVRRWMSTVDSYCQAHVNVSSDLNLEHQELIVLLKIAKEHYMEKYPNEYGRFDLHPGNALARGKTFVVTDPLA